MLDLNLFANHIRHRNTFGVVDGLALLPLDRVANFLGLVLANLPRLHPAQIIRYIYMYLQVKFTLDIIQKSIQQI